MKHNLEYWTHMARGSLYRVTSEQAAAIANMCLIAEGKGENCSVWHQASIYFKTSCHCAQCEPPRRTEKRGG